MAETMKQFKQTANAHMRRDMEKGGKWVCNCEACHEIRSLLGMDKMLGIRPLIRELQDISAQLEGMPEGEERSRLVQQYQNLHDRLAEEMAK